MASRIRKGELIPPFSLNDLNDETIDSSNFSRKKNLVIFFFERLEEKNQRYTEMLNTIYEQLREQEAEILAFSSEKPEVLNKFAQEKRIKFSILLDTGNKVTYKFLKINAPTLFITDRFQSLYRAYSDILPAKEEILSSIDFIEKQCPECGVTHWPENLE